MLENRDDVLSILHSHYIAYNIHTLRNRHFLLHLTSIRSFFSLLTLTSILIDVVVFVSEVSFIFRISSSILMQLLLLRATLLPFIDLFSCRCRHRRRRRYFVFSPRKMAEQ